MDSERAQQSSTVSRPCNHLARSNNEPCVRKKIAICKTSAAEIRAADECICVVETERDEKDDEIKKEKR